MTASKKPEKVTFVFDGMEFECIPSVIRNYKIQKAISNSQSNPAAYYNAMSAIFDGKDEEYAEMVGGDMERFAELYVAAVNAVGAKN